MAAALVVRAIMTALAVGLLCLGLVSCNDNKETDTTVTVYTDGEVLATNVPRQQAVENVSGRVQFPVLLATKLPDSGLKLLVIEARMAQVPEEMGDDGRTNHVATILYVAGEVGSPDSTALRILEYSREVTPPDGTTDVEIDGSVLHVLEIGPGGRSFTWNDGDRGYIVELGEPVGEEEITNDDIMAMLRSLK